MEIINLDMVPGKKSPVCHASQYDDGRVIRFNLYDSGLPYTLDGTETITFEVRKPDGNIVTSTLTNTSDSYVDVVTTEQMTAVKGANLCEMRVEKGATNIGSLNVIMAVEMDPTDGGIASASDINNLRSQVSGMVAEEVAEQYDAGSVIFDSAPTPGHGNGYAVTSEGVNNALAPKADRSELPDMSNYYTKSETDTALNDKVNTSDFEATNLPISDSDPTNTKDYIDGKTASDIEYSSGVTVKQAIDGKANISDVKELKSLSQSFTISANSSITIQANSSRIQCLLFGVSDSQYVASVAYLIGGYVTASRCVVTNLSGLTGLTINSSSTTDMKFVITNTQAFSVSFNIYNLIGSGFTVVT